MKRLILAIVLVAIAQMGSFAYEVKVGKDTIFTDVKEVVVYNYNAIGRVLDDVASANIVLTEYVVVLKDGSEWTVLGTGSALITDAPVRYSFTKRKKK